MIINLKTALKYIILLLIGVGVLYLAFKGQNLETIWDEIKTANLYWIIFSSFIVWLAHVLRALRWQMLYNSIQYKISFWNTYHAVMIGYLANLALPRFGEIVRCSVVHKTENIPVFASIGTVITERLFDVLILLLTGFALLIFQYNLVSDFLYNTIYLSFINKIQTINYFWIIGIFVLIIALFSTVIYLLRNKFNTKFLRIYASLKQGFNSYNNLANKPLFLLYTFCIWLFYFLSIYIAFSAIVSTHALGLNTAFTAIVFSGFAMVAPVQGGIGVFHWMVAQALLLHGIAFKDGLAYATIIHSSQVLLILILGSLSLFFVLTKK